LSGLIGKNDTFRTNI